MFRNMLGCYIGVERGDIVMLLVFGFLLICIRIIVKHLIVIRIVFKK